MSGRHDVSILPPLDAGPPREDFVLVDIPEYETYSLLSLYQVLNSIRADRYPEVYEALQKEIGRRVPESVTELEDCYFALDKDKHPGYEASLRSQIEQLGGFQRTRIEPITEQNKYRTFWRRFWAWFLDGFVVAIPLAIGASVAQAVGLIESTTSPYARQTMELLALAYTIVMHARYGQTVGKMATGVKVLDVSESKDIGLRQALLREIVPLFVGVLSTVYLVVFGAMLGQEEVTGPAAVVLHVVGFAFLLWIVSDIVTMLFNRKRRSVHDFVAGTVVVRIAN